jgi:hypothetical protein
MLQVFGLKTIVTPDFFLAAHLAFCAAAILARASALTGLRFLIAIGFWLYQTPGHGTSIEQLTH